MKMKKFIVALFVLLLTGGVTVSYAQLRKAKIDPSEYRGPIFKEDPSEGAKLSNLFNMTMSHSYTMTFSSVGGQYQNLNMYINTMRFYFTEDLTGRIDLAIMHSPFGGSKRFGLGADQGVEFLVRNAELNYEISDNAHIKIRYQQVPNSYYGYYGRYRRGFGRYSTFSPFPSLYR